MDLATKNKNASEYKRNMIAVSVLSFIVIPSGFYIDPMIGIGAIVLSAISVSTTFIMSKKFTQNDELEYAKTKTPENAKAEVVDESIIEDIFSEFVYKENKASLKNKA